MRIVTAVNQGVEPARPGEFGALRLGPIELRTPVVLAPMAGVTNAAYRVLCRRFGEALYVSEMTTARGLVERNARTLQMARFRPEESPRSLQLYGTSPEHLHDAARILIDEFGVEHLDLNLGCPVRKVTRSGGGSAIPVKPRLLSKLLQALVDGARHVPVTIKMRLGIHEDLLTFRQAGRIAEDHGVCAVGLHARTAAQLYDGDARWDAIGELQSMLGIPVLGNGDIWEAEDALRMMRQTGCAGVIVGRGCLGRPWLFRELEALFAGRPAPPPPCFREIHAICIEHAKLLIEELGERLGLMQIRKHATWYTKSFPGGARLRPRLTSVRTLDDLDAALDEIPDETPFPYEGLRVRRCKKSGTQQVALPDGYLDDLDDDTAPSSELVVEGG
ncbi:MAG: tRNA dihydrouridine synthase DusB [Planctomycetes bacterium]|nr:tRNA dihydrouridine synthase DusB [Planctomycetota bacterium]